MNSVAMNSVYAAALLGVSALVLVATAMSDLPPLDNRCQDVRQGSIIEVVNCPQTPMPRQIAANRIGPALAEAREARSVLR